MGHLKLIVTAVSQDRFDEMRRAWIATHQGWSTIQRRRVRARQRAMATAVPDPHDDTVIPSLWLRAANSPASQLELLGIVAARRFSAYDITGPGLLDAQPLNEPGDRTRP